MAKNRASTGGFTRPSNTKEEKKTLQQRELLNFNFKDLDETQPCRAPQTLIGWQTDKRLSILFTRLTELSKLTREEACQQEQIKIYGNFPTNTDFTHPKHIDSHVAWGVIKNIGGQKGGVAGYIAENTFYIVFLDSEHKFWITPKKNT